MKQKLNLLALLLIALAVTSCRTRTQMIYLQDFAPDVEYPVQPTKDLVIQNDDNLTIKVTCKNPDYSISNDGTIHSTATTGTDATYTVTEDGTIDFPILGKIQARGLTCRQLSESIKKELQSRSLITDPFVTTQITNFTYSVLGEAKKVGTVEVKGKERVTILDAVAQAGDLTQDAKLERIAVIREENGKRKIYHVDIRSKSIFESPVFYLKQNDLIYIEPNDNKVREESRRNLQWIFTGASLLTTVISLITLIKK